MFLALIIITLISAIGMFFTFQNKISHKILSILVAFGAGSMLTVSLLHIFPEAIMHAKFGALAFLAGFVGMYLLEEIFAPHSHDHQHHDHSHEDPHEHSHHIAIVAFLAIFVHTLLDGMAIRASMNLSETISYAVIFGIAIHQIPVSLSLAAIFKKSKLSKAIQITLMILFALAVAIGFGLSHAIFEIIWENFATLATAFAGGSLLYIATVDLLPMTHNENTKKFPTILAFSAWVTAMTLLQILGHDFHSHEHHNHSQNAHHHAENHSHEHTDNHDEHHH